MFFLHKKELDQHSLRGRILCSEACMMKIGKENGSAYPCRVREFNWFGFMVDKLSCELEKNLGEVHPSECSFTFSLPRDFGRMEIEAQSLTVVNYEESVLGQVRMMSLNITLSEGSELDRIREFIEYRNRRFKRHKRSKLRATGGGWRFYTMIFMITSVAVMLGLSAYHLLIRN